MEAKEINKRVLLPLQKGDTDNARRAFLRIKSELKPWQRCYIEGAFHQSSGNFAKAEQCYQQAIELSNEPHYDLLINQCSVLQLQGRHFESTKYAEAALRLRPADIKAVKSALAAYLDHGNSTKALSLIESLPEKLKKDKHIELGKVASLRQGGSRQHALQNLGSLLERYPEDPVVLRMYADTIGDEDSESALPFYERALDKSEAQSPSSSAIKWNMSLHLLRLRHFKRGWEYYQEGLSASVGTLGRKLPDNLRGYRLLTLEDACSVKSQWVLIIVEQGIGDQIMFMSALREAIEIIDKPIFMCEPRMKQIIARSFPSLQLVDPGLLEYITHSDLPIEGYLPLGSIMGRFRQTEADFVRNRKPYLVVDKSYYVDYRNELVREAAGRPIVGISWKGGFWENQQRNKTIGIEQWEPLFQRDCLVVNLQYGDVSTDEAWLASRGHKMRMFEGVDFKKDLDRWLAITAACDGIVSVSTALVHFAGAINQKVALIMPEKQGPYIWGVDKSRSIVYPHVHIFRPNRSESIAELLRRVSKVIV
jgi:tetratricopeptide (TPR) repeat protein